MACCGIGLLYYVIAVIDQAVHVEAVGASGRVDELPHAGGSGAGVGLGLEGRLNYRQVLELQGYVVFHERLHEYVLIDGHHTQSK